MSDDELKKKLQTIARYAGNVERIENGISFMIKGEPCEMRLIPRASVHKGKLVLKCNLDLVIAGCIWLGVSFGDSPNFSYSDDLLKLYDRLQILMERSKDRHRSDINDFISNLV